MGSKANAPPQIFDRRLKQAHRDRAAHLQSDDDPLLGEVTERLLDRLEDCRRSFPVAAIIGGAGTSVAARLTGARAGVETLLHLDDSPAMLAHAARLQQASGTRWPQVHHLAAEEEWLPLREKSVDVIISSLSLHWVNDLPGAMVQCRRALKPDGLFLSAMWGGSTLQELRIAHTLAEQEVEGGLSPRMSPLVQVRDAGNLLTRAGLNIPSVDVDELTVHYGSPSKLVDHLRAMAESNAVYTRRPTMRRATAAAAERIYREKFGAEDGSVPATFEVIYMTGWAPAALQPQALRRGSATVKLEDLAEMQRQRDRAASGAGRSG
ncbi:hypothetical protein WJX81_002822 [Elliptochloris bilobata]|uniref:Methyltransferase type 11 domain-containing protein n=1 Tax=Elliptochloris bilobata TaxID=381761 RepID=A0AAW1RUU6_9CHLO